MFLTKPFSPNQLLGEGEKKSSRRKIHEPPAARFLCLDFGGCGVKNQQVQCRPQLQPPGPNARRSPFLACRLTASTLAEILALAGEMIASGRPHYATTVGVDFLVQSLEDVELRRILFDAHLVVAEEKALIRASKILGNPLPESVTVPSLIPQLLALAEQKNWRVFLLGGGDGAAEKIRARQPQLKLAGAYAPPEKPLLEMDHADILHRLREAKPDILLVAFGSPKQEKWINMNYREAGVPFVLGAGATFDFLTGAGARPGAPGQNA